MNDKLQSLGHACGLYQRSPAAIRDALRAIGASVVIQLNGVDHYRTRDVERAIARIRKAETKRASK